ncbi:hypothetical protein Tco_0157170, partial [Tanacetum coccineum]
DEGVTRVKAFMAIAENEPVMGKTDARSGGRGKKKEAISLKEIVFTKGDNSSYKTSPDVNSDTESVDDNQEPLPSLLKLSQGLSPLDDLSTKELLITLMKEVKGLKEQIKSPSENSSSVSKIGSSTSGKGKKMKFGPCSMTIALMSVSTTLDVTSVEVLLMNPLNVIRESFLITGDQILLDSNTEGYGSVNCNGITFTRVTYVNGLKHNLISISQLCDVNFKVLFTKTQRTIFNQNNEVVLIAPGRRDVYISDMSSYNEESNTCFFAKVSIIVERHGKTTYDVFRGRSPDISYFHVFGCLVFIHKQIDHLGKFDEKADDAFFLGYSLVAKAFRVFNIIRQEMEETYHVTFNELDEDSPNDDQPIDVSSEDKIKVIMETNDTLFPKSPLTSPRTLQIKDLSSHVLLLQSQKANWRKKIKQLNLKLLF